MYRVNKNNNGKRCTWVSDENHCMYTITVFAGCTVILITFPSAPLLVVIFVDSVYLYCYCYVSRCYCIWFVILLTDSFSHIKLVYLFSFQLVQVLLNMLKVPSDIKSLILSVFNMFPRPLDSLPP